DKDKYMDAVDKLFSIIGQKPQRISYKSDGHCRPTARIICNTDVYEIKQPPNKTDEKKLVALLYGLAKISNARSELIFYDSAGDNFSTKHRRENAGKTQKRIDEWLS
ncbi:MAG: hypothetical protein QW761_02895, partial [Candidatus Aenigmatarchaeota archaeon]